MSPRAIDLCWEALVEETAANPEMERGKLNTALRAIKTCAFGEGFVDEQGVATEIHLRAQAYRNLWPHLTLTPTALATHWRRVMVQTAAPAQSAQQLAFQQARMRVDA
jgi:hypothetical protein